MTLKINPIQPGANIMFNWTSTNKKTHKAILLEKDGKRQSFRFKIEDYNDKLDALLRDGWKKVSFMLLLFIATGCKEVESFYHCDGDFCAESQQQLGYIRRHEEERAGLKDY